ncbi:MAG: LytTR family DNA-binding domain-containing protein [Cytophagales bacterium]|nr:LytTR family DNA-binding domain-containing protein [Cytophagales bacterium]
MNINCIIVDDEALARKGLAKYINVIEFLKLKGVCKNAIEANAILNKKNIDLIFLDIEMPALSGIDFLKAIKQSPKIIFTTAYSEYAIESFEFDVLDYLVKPISFDRFLQAANKAHRLIAEASALKFEERTSGSNDDYVFIKAEKQLVKVKLRDILFVESMQNYIRIFTAAETHITLIPLKKILNILPRDLFIQVHKSYLIAKNAVDAIAGNQILIGKHKIPIGRSMREEVLETLVREKVLKK